MSLHSSLHSVRFGAALAAAVITFGGALPSASAKLLVDPSSGDVLLSGVYTGFGDDDRTVGGSYPINSNFFGFMLFSPFVTISVNGNLFFGAGDNNDNAFLTPLGTDGVDRVAPMWADYKLSAEGQIIETVHADYYAVSWLNLEDQFGAAGTASFQVIFIEADTTLGGAQFGSGDIIFSYGEISLYSAIPEVIVGLGDMFGQSADLNNFQGWLSYGYSNDFPVGENQYMLFRPNGSDNYDVTVENVIPEPTTYAAITAVATLALVLWRRRVR